MKDSYTQFKIYRDGGRTYFEVVEVDSIHGKALRSYRERLGTVAARYFNGCDKGFVRYFVAKAEQRLLFGLGLRELPL